MYSVDDIKTCIQEWFADATDCVEVAKVYSEIILEAENQLEIMMDERRVQNG